MRAIPWNGSGVFYRTDGVFTGPEVWEDDRDAGFKIRADHHDVHDQDLADGIQLCLTKDGQNEAIADLPMGGFKHTDVDDATARNQYGVVGQIQDGGYIWGGSAGGTATALTCATTPLITSYVSGMVIRLRATSAATGASTLNAGGGVKDIKKFHDQAIAADDWEANQVLEFVYESTDDTWQYTGQLANTVTASSTTTFTNKTIDGDDNTVQDLAWTSVIKTAAGNANKVAGYAATTGAPVNLTTTNGVNSNGTTITLDITGLTQDGTPDNSADYVATYDASASTNKKVLIKDTYAPFVYLRDQESSGTNGGTFTSGSWQTRVLNTEVTDTGSVCSLSSNQFTLSAGTYRIWARAPGKSCNSHKLKLYNVTDTADILIGSSAYADAAGNGQSDSIVEGQFTVAASKALEIQHRCSSTRATEGLGVASSFSVVEVYAEVQLWKVG